MTRCHPRSDLLPSIWCKAQTRAICSHGITRRRA
jgi:hypothetical protein